MRIKAAIERIPAGMMIVPLFLGAVIHTIDKLHLDWVQRLLMALGTKPAGKNADGQEVYELLRIGGFTEALFGTGALCLIALFLFCAGSQMNLRIGGRSLVKGASLTVGKYAAGVGIGFLIGAVTDPMTGILGLSTMAVIAAMTNGNGGMYVALTGQYGNRSDVGSVSVLSFNDGPFFTLIALSMLGQQFPYIIFVAVLMPILIGMILGNLDEDLRTFFAPGERLLIPFFAFALGATMNLNNFLNGQALIGGILLGLATVVITGGVNALLLRFVLRERSVIAAVAEASTAGNAFGTPLAVTTAAVASAGLAAKAAEAAPGDAALASAAETAQALAAGYQSILPLAQAQISIAILVTAILCPVAVVLVNRWQLARGIDGRAE